MANTRTPAGQDGDSQNTAIAGLDSLELGATRQRREPGRIARKAWTATWPKLLAIGLVLGAWQLFYLSDFHGDTSTGLVKGPGSGLASLWDQLQHGQLWSAIGNTVRTAVVGYLLAMLIGSVLGAIVSRIPPLRAATGSIISGLQTMPSIAWFPFAIILFGTSESAILFVMVLGAAPSIANGLITGVDYTPPLLLRAGRTMGLRGIALYRHLVLPASLPAYLAGLKQGWAFAWRSLMAGELLVIIVGNLSLGILLNNAQDDQDLTGAIAVMIVILMIGIVVDTIFSKTDLAVRRRRGLLIDARSV
ncbi:MAG TPA: ABC transporter permease [Streptosporangiaceae bacterium]